MEQQFIFIEGDKVVKRKFFDTKAQARFFAQNFLKKRATITIATIVTKV